MLVRSIKDLKSSIEGYAVREEPNGLLLVEPDEFSVTIVTNTHTKDKVGSVDAAAARRQWDHLKDIYTQLGMEVAVQPAVEGLQEQVFSANVGIVFRRGGKTTVIPSVMRDDHRQPEVDRFREWCRAQGYSVVELTKEAGVTLEGMGDLFWHPGRELLYAGNGFRTTLPAIEQVAELFAVDVVPLELVDERWYHLDTALSTLNEETAVIVPQAFTPEGLDILRKLFPRLIELTLEEAMSFVANGYSPDGEHFVVQAWDGPAKELLQEAGFEVIEVETGEFLKGGGSVFCMKLPVYL